MLKFAIVGLVGLLGSCAGQETVIMCKCVDSRDCTNGVASPDAEGVIIDYSKERCPGLKICCKSPDRSEQTFSPSPPSYDSSPTDETNAAAAVRPSSDIDAPVLPNKVRKSGCGIRRTKGFLKPADPADLRKGQPSTGNSGCKRNPSWPKVGATQFRVEGEEGDPGCEPPKPSWPMVSNTQQRLAADEGIAVDTFYGELPWMVRVNINGKFECGGTLIGPHAVLTAAHCVKGKQAVDLTVEAGEWNTSSTSEPEVIQKREIITVISHQNFNSETGQHDVALLYTKQAFDFTATVDIICLGERFQYLDEEDCYVAGWGKPNASDPHFSMILRKIPIPLVNNSYCQELFRQSELGPQFVLLSGFTCIGGVDGRDTCKGDGGGPLFCSTKHDPDRFAVAGVISWGLECGKGHPSVVAGIPYYHKWIDYHSAQWMNTVLPALGN